MVQMNVQPDSQPQSIAPGLEEPAIPLGGKLAAAGGGVIASVCCGKGLIAVLATVLGAGSVVAFTTSWVKMQGVTLVSAAFAIGLVLAIAAHLTRSAREGMGSVDARRVYGRTLLRLTGWALGGYVVYFIGFNMVLSLVGFEYLGK
jgi:hypothetical protein